MSAPRYVERFARLPQVLAALETHPEGMSLDELAGQVGAKVNELREDLLAFFTADVQTLLGLSRPAVLEFRGADDDEVDPNVAVRVRIIDERPSEELGAEYLDAAELGLIWMAAQALAEVEPENVALREAIEVLTDTVFGTDQDASLLPSRVPTGTLDRLRFAIAERRLVEITYSRAWSAGASTRVIAPYKLEQTRRGWEVDAGAMERDGALRTFLLGNVAEATVLDERYELPADLGEALIAQRRTETVRVRIPHEARWVADMYAENVDLVDEDAVLETLDLGLLPPIRQRVGLILLTAGLDAAVLRPAGLVSAGPELAARLLAHHRKG